MEGLSRHGEGCCGGEILRSGKVKALLLLLLLPLTPLKAEARETKCPGLATYEMRVCASQKWEESNWALKKQLTPAVLDKWTAATEEVCAAAYAPYREGTIFPQMIIGCNDRLNLVLIEELQGLGR